MRAYESATASAKDYQTMSDHSSTPNLYPKHANPKQSELCLLSSFAWPVSFVDTSSERRCWVHTLGLRLRHLAYIELARHGTWSWGTKTLINQDLKLWTSFHVQMVYRSVDCELQQREATARLNDCDSVS